MTPISGTFAPRLYSQVTPDQIHTSPVFRTLKLSYSNPLTWGFCFVLTKPSPMSMTKPYNGKAMIPTNWGSKQDLEFIRCLFSPRRKSKEVSRLVRPSSRSTPTVLTMHHHQRYISSSPSSTNPHTGFGPFKSIRRNIKPYDADNKPRIRTQRPLGPKKTRLSTGEAFRE